MRRVPARAAEAGDAVLTFPPEHLADRETYERAVAAASPERARARRDLAEEGFLELRTRTEAPGVAAVAERTGREIDALAAGDHSHLRSAAVARVERPPQTTPGMCGYLAPY